MASNLIAAKVKSKEKAKRMAAVKSNRITIVRNQQMAAVIRKTMPST